jgi:uncharacterized protein YdeI (YjbR/CyaY-like superfamily)
MKKDINELCFKTRNEFREWLNKNAETSDGVWLIFGKEKNVVTLTTNDALEEALCFGWIDGQMKSVDDTKYIKYFARRQTKSVWSDKNRKIVEMLRDKKMMTEFGEKAVEDAKKYGTWNTAKGDPITNEQVETFAKEKIGISPAYENFKQMSPSVQRTYTKRYLSFKSDVARQKDFEKIIDRLNKNLKPM